MWLSSKDLRLRFASKKLSPRYMGNFKIPRQITCFISSSLTIHLSHFSYLSCFLAKTYGWSEGTEEPGRGRKIKFPSYHHRRRGGLPSKGDSRLKMLLQGVTVLVQLGWVWSRGEILSEITGHPELTAEFHQNHAKIPWRRAPYLGLITCTGVFTSLLYINCLRTLSHCEVF